MPDLLDDLRSKSRTEQPECYRITDLQRGGRNRAGGGRERGARLGAGSFHVGSISLREGRAIRVVLLAGDPAAVVIECEFAGLQLGKTHVAAIEFCSCPEDPAVYTTPVAGDLPAAPTLVRRGRLGCCVALRAPRPNLGIHSLILSFCALCGSHWVDELTEWNRAPSWCVQARMDFEVRHAIIDEGFDPDDPSTWVAMWSVSEMLREIAKTPSGAEIIDRSGSLPTLQRWLDRT